MMILTEDNKAVNTDQLTSEINFSTLSFRDYKNPDFYLDQRIEYLEEFNSASITLRIGTYEIVMPLHWSIVCTDMENIQTIPLQEVSGRNFDVFCLNPIDGYRPRYRTLRTGMIFPNTTWTCPPIRDKDMLVVPITTESCTETGTQVGSGPLCAIFSPSKIEVYKPISDIW